MVTRTPLNVTSYVNWLSCFSPFWWIFTKLPSWRKSAVEHRLVFSLTNHVTVLLTHVYGLHPSVILERQRGSTDRQTQLSSLSGFIACNMFRHLEKAITRKLKIYIKKRKVIQKNQLDATITIYLSPRSAQHISGNRLPIFRSARLSFYNIWYSVLVL